MTDPIDKNFKQAYLRENKDVIARHIEDSPFISFLNSDKVIRGIYAERYFPISVDENIIEKYWLLRQKAALFDVPEKPIEITGKDSEKFLDYIFCRDLSGIKIGRGYYCLACTPKGGIFMDGILFKLETDRYWYVQADGQFETWLLANSNGFNVNISNPHVWVLQIQGPASTSVLKDASNNSLDESFGYYRSDFFDLGGQKIYVSRTGYTNELGYELYCPSDINHKALWDHLMKCGAPYGMEFSSTRAMTMRRIEGGIRENLVDMDTSVNPYDVGLGQFVNLDKENFIGKSSLINANKENKLFGVICKKSVPEVHAKITKSGEEIGKITSGVFSPTLKCGIGFLRLNSPLKIIGEEVQMILSDDSIENCEVVDLPFFDQEKKIARGLDTTIPDVS